jgi:hypothetical protein
MNKKVFAAAVMITCADCGMYGRCIAGENDIRKDRGGI